MPALLTPIGWRASLCAAVFLMADPLRGADPPAADPAGAPAPAGTKGAGAADANQPADRATLERNFRQEQSRLERDARQQQAAGNLSAAIASAQEMLAVETDFLGADHDDANSSLQLLAVLASLSGDSAAGRQYAEQSLANQVRMRGTDSWSAATSRQVLALVERIGELSEAERKELNGALMDYRKQLDLAQDRKYAAALEAGRRAAATYRKLLPQPTGKAADNLLQIGYIQSSLEQYAEALLSIKEALQIYRQAVGNVHPDTIKCLAAAGNAHWYLKEFDQAARNYREAALAQEKLFGATDSLARSHRTSAASSLDGWASGLEERGELAEAVKVRAQALAAWKRLFADDDYRVRNARGWLAHSEQLSKLPADERRRLVEAGQLHAKCSQMFHAGKYDPALEAGEKALAIRREVLGNESTDAAISLNLLGLVHLASKDYARAEASLAEAVEIWRAARGDDHPEFGITVQNLADVYMEADKLDQAQQLTRQALAIRRRCYGAGHEDTQSSVSRLILALGNLADKHSEAGQYADAKPIRAEVVELSKEYKGPDHWQTRDATWRLKNEEALAATSAEEQQLLADAAAMQTQANQFATAKQFGPAIAAIEEAGRLHVQVFGAQSLPAARDLLQSGEFNTAQGNTGRAVELYGQVRDIIKAELGTDHPYYANMLAKLAYGAQAQKKLLTAVDELREAWQIYQRGFGASDSNTQEAVKQLLNALAQLAAEQEAKPDLAAAKKSRDEVVTVMTSLYGEKDWRVNDARWAAYQTELAISWRGNQRQQLKQADGLLAQAAQAHGQLKQRDDNGFAQTSADLKRQTAQSGVQAATQAVSLRKQVLGEGNPAVADALEWLATLERDQGSDAAAQTSYEQAMAIRKKAQGLQHPSYAKTRDALSRTIVVALATPFQRPSKLTPAQQQRIDQRDWYENRVKQLEGQEDWQGAYRAAQSMLQIEREVLGEVHEETASSYRELAVLAINLGNLADARQNRLREIEIYTKLNRASDYQVMEARHYVALFDRFTALNREQVVRLIKAKQMGAELQKNRDREVFNPQFADTVLAASDGVLQTLRELFGEDCIYCAETLRGKAIAYAYKGDDEAIENTTWQVAELIGRAFGKQHPRYFDELNKLADSAQNAATSKEQAGDFAAAEKAWNKWIVVQTLHYGGNHWKVRKARERLALCHQVAKMSPADRQAFQEVQRTIAQREIFYEPRPGATGELATTREIYETCLRLLGAEDPLTIARHHELAVELRGAGELAVALPMLRKSLDLHRKVKGADHPDTARAANDLGLTYYRVGAYVDAEPLLRQARDTLEKLNRIHDPAYASSLNNLAVVYEALGDFDRAEPLLKQVVSMRGQTDDEIRADPEQETAQAGRYEAMMGEFNVSVAFNANKRDTVSNPPPRVKEFKEIAQYVNNLALLYQARGDLKQAESLMRQALWLIRLGDTDGTSPHYAVALSNLAVLYEKQGNLDRAEMLLERVIDIRKQQSIFDPKYATALNNLGVITLRRGDFERTGQLWREALEKRRTLLGEGNPNTLVSKANLALLDDRQGRPVAAAKQLDEVLDLAGTNLRLAAAIQSERQQLTLRQALRGYLDFYLSVATRAGVPSDNVYRHVLAWKGAVGADQRRLRELRELGRAKGGEEIARLYAALEQTTRELANLRFGAAGENELPHRLFAEMTVRKDDLERELAQRSKQLGRTVTEPISLAQLKEYLPPKTALVDFVEYSYAAPGAPAASDKTGADKAGAEKASAEKSGGGRKSLDNRERRLLAFVVTKDRPLAMHELGPADQVDKLVDQCRTLWLRGQGAAASDPAAELKNLIWQPLVAELGGAETVLVAPDGATSRLPFAALPGSQPDTYLIEDVAIAVVPAPQLLGELLSAAAQRASSAAPKMLLVGNVDFGADPGVVSGKASGPSLARGGAAPRGGKPTHFAELPATATEVQSVQKLYQGKFKSGSASLLDQAKATESEVRKQAVAAKYLHLATHGFFAPADVKSADLTVNDPFALTTDTTEQKLGWNPGLLSGVVLAGVNRPPDGSHDDGILTAAEVADMNLSAAPLVVLSACETGLGQVTSGEGALGLQRAFHVAGASTVLASLWKVDDRATQLLMTEFYDNLWSKNLPPLAALRTAQLSLLQGKVDAGALRGLDVADDGADDAAEENTAASKRLSPRLWAAFVLSGSPN